MWPVAVLNAGVARQMANRATDTLVKKRVSNLLPGALGKALACIYIYTHITST